jgi:hypothetical protein
MKARPRAAFVVTVSMLGSIALAGCGKTGAGGSSECKPPDCHINPPPPPPTPTMISANPPPIDLSAADAGAKDAGSKPLAK